MRLFTVPSGSSQHRRHLFVGVAAEVGQLDGLAELVGQCAQRLLHLVGDGHVPDLAVDVVAGRGRLARGPLLTLPPGHLGADEVDRLPVGAGQEEGAQRAPLGIELLRVVPQVEEDLLGDLLGGRIAPQDPPGQGVDGSAVAAVHLGQRRLVPATHRHHQVGVTGLLHIHQHELYSVRTRFQMRRGNGASHGTDRSGRDTASKRRSMTDAPMQQRRHRPAPPTRGATATRSNGSDTGCGRHWPEWP